MNRGDLIGLRVALNPQQFGAGVSNGLPGRRGTIIGFDDDSHGWPVCELDLVGRERKQKRVTMPLHTFIELTEHNERVLREWEDGGYA